MESGAESSASKSHPIFHRNPADYMQYVNKEVCVTAKDGTTHSGRLYTIDPVSESMVLIKFADGHMSELDLVLGKSVEGLIVLDDNTDKYKSELDALFKVNLTSDKLTKEELNKRKERLKSWLLKNRLPIEESHDNPDLLTLSDALLIEPPYTADDCRSTNEIILGRVQGLMKNIPNDVDDW